MLRPRPLLGDFLATRNELESDNASPGHWNHVGVFAAGVVVEALRSREAVVARPWDVFYDNYPELLILRWKQPGVCPDIAAKAMSLIGQPYRTLGSLRWRLGRRWFRGENCVSTVRHAVWAATGVDPKWRIPDDLVRDSRVEEVFSKSELTKPPR